MIIITRSLEGDQAAAHPLHGFSIGGLKISASPPDREKHRGLPVRPACRIIQSGDEGEEENHAGLYRFL